MAFKRFLNPTAFNKAKQFKEIFSDWQRNPGSIVHLRPNNCVAFYLMGQKAFEMGQLGATDEFTKIFQRDPIRGVNPSDLPEQLRQARKAVTDDIKKNKKDELELSRQSLLAWELLRRNKEFTLIDEQVQVPQEALADKAQEQTRVDLLVLEQKTQKLAVLELKLSENPDLDGPVLGQLKTTRALPGALKGGEKTFLAHYQQLFAQKVELGLVVSEPAELKGISDKSLIILGDEPAARARLACLDQAAIPENYTCALLAAAAPLAEAAFRPLKAQVEAAIAGPRPAYAPRKERWNAFTRLADKEQAAWSAIKPKQNQAGPFDAALAGYFEKNNIAVHPHLKHPRSSQAACAQAFAAILAKTPLAETGLLKALNDNVSPSWGVTVTAVTDCHFEVPHGLVPGGPNAFPRADMQALTGETGKFHTSLDAALAVTGTRDGKEVRALIGIEFKYSEPEFTSCGGFTSEGFTEPGRQACLNGKDRGASCYLRHQEKRKYVRTEELDAMFGAPNPVDRADGACLLLGPVNQLYRGHYTVLKLKEQFGFDEALFLVVYDNRNLSLLAPERPSPENRPALAPMERYKEALAAQYKPTFAQLPVQVLVEAYTAAITRKPPAWLTKLKARYHW
ncbi:MAG: hypothetical protein A2016_10765 [Elusimicrobia bacterium GWF2_62_30]|nr:MAG: hypothetical protein A2016_10765 [Elusimicrobia bacterium GWF2_62_30]